MPAIRLPLEFELGKYPGHRPNAGQTVEHRLRLISRFFLLVDIECQSVRQKALTLLALKMHTATKVVDSLNRSDDIGAFPDWYENFVREQRRAGVSVFANKLLLQGGKLSGGEYDWLAGHFEQAYAMVPDEPGRVEIKAMSSKWAYLMFVQAQVRKCEPLEKHIVG